MKYLLLMSNHMKVFIIIFADTSLTMYYTKME